MLLEVMIVKRLVQLALLDDCYVFLKKLDHLEDKLVQEELKKRPKQDVQGHPGLLVTGQIPCQQQLYHLLWVPQPLDELHLIIVIFKLSIWIVAISRKFCLRRNLIFF